MYFTSRGALAGDLVCGINGVEKLERERRGVNEKVRVVLVAHSAGAGLGQYVLSRRMVSVSGLCIFAGVPGFGS
jgi:pimeloyl-ACP methyl ester carboxylesterase